MSAKRIPENFLQDKHDRACKRPKVPPPPELLQRRREVSWLCLLQEFIGFPKKNGFNFVYACCWGVWWAFQTLPIKACEEGLLVYFRNHGYDEHFARQHVDFQDMLCQLLPNSFNVFCHETSVHRWILIGSLKMIKWLYLLRFLPPFAGTWLERSP